MLRTIRRVGTAVAVLALAGGSVVAAAPTASAATPANCLKHLKGGFDNSRTIVAPRTKLHAQTTIMVNRVCFNMRVSIGISRTDKSGFRNQAATRRWWEKNAYYFTSDFNSLPGDWMVRQIAVGDASGRVAIRKFDTAGTYFVRALSESRLTGKPTGKIRLDPGRGGYFFGYLKAYSRYGTWTALAPGQRIRLQARPHGTKWAYQTLAEGRTSKSGFYQIWLAVPRGQWDVRVAYVSPYKSVASDITWLGTAY